MSKRGSILQAEADVSEINISPMIDMVFILLIFFIVTTVFVEEPGVEVARIAAVTAQDLEKNSILIAITADDTVVYGGRNVGVAGVRSIVRRLLDDGDMPVILQVDQGASAGTVIRVVDEARLADATVFIGTQNN